MQEVVAGGDMWWVWLMGWHGFFDDCSAEKGDIVGQENISRPLELPNSIAAPKADKRQAASTVRATVVKTKKLPFEHTIGGSIKEVGNMFEIRSMMDMPLRIIIRIFDARFDPDPALCRYATLGLQ
ncbi:MAG: hypothetical protein JXQ99_23210 [Hyphomicrobiaceae bacterium]